MLWWIWVLLGFFLLLVELLTPGGLYLLFFGIAAIIVGLLAGVQLSGPSWFDLAVLIHDAQGMSVVAMSHHVTGLNSITFGVFRGLN